MVENEATIRITSGGCFSFGPMKPVYKFAEDVKKIAKSASDAVEKLIEAENSYLENRGFKMHLDHVEGVILWKKPETPGCAYSYGDIREGGLCTRERALDIARHEEDRAKEHAEDQIARLKAEHGIEDPTK